MEPPTPEARRDAKRPKHKERSGRKPKGGGGRSGAPSASPRAPTPDDYAREADSHTCSLHRITSALLGAAVAPRHQREGAAKTLRALACELRGLADAAAEAADAATEAATQELPELRGGQEPRECAWTNPSETARIIKGGVRAPDPADSPVARGGALVGRAGLATPRAAPKNISARPPALALAPAPAPAPAPFAPAPAPFAPAPVKGAACALPRPAELAPKVGVPPDGHLRGEERAEIVIAGQISLNAILVPEGVSEPRDVAAYVASADLYYVPAWGHFAVRVGGVVFHGNVATIYPGRAGAGRSERGPGVWTPDAGPPQKGPARVSECRRGRRCAGGCGYYHDPAAGGGGREVRNFVTDSWIYAPPGTRAAARCGTRSFGSRDFLEADLLRTTPRTARRHLAQTAHDIVCALILAKYALAAQ